MSTTIPDNQERLDALTPNESFIIQAPAGSGKTELLTQRFLKLLGHATTSPEEIMAITFTRKAAAEMRERIMMSLELASSDCPIEPHKKHTWQLAKIALDKNTKYDWDLLNNPNRLRIITIDSLSAMINAYTPILSHLGGSPNITEDASLYYQLASENLLLSCLKDPQHSESISTILINLDNKATRFISLCTQLLQKREQWLPYIIQSNQDRDQLRDQLEHALQIAALDSITALADCFDTTRWTNLRPLLNQAAEALSTDDPSHPLCDFITLKHNPSISLEDMPYWQVLVEILLTKNNQWRKKLDKRLGFPAKSAHKAPMLTLLEELQTIPGLKQALIALRHAPPFTYSNTQWKMLTALTNILPLLAANFHLVMQQYNIIDFTELSLGALRALGDEEEPTDAALHLDYHIKHFLIDEYQDTSITQHHLIQAITHHWQPDDGRTIFCVGDPMQSIYRFRNANVGLFLRTSQQGINQIPLTSLSLKVNFRSNRRLIDWFNSTFSEILPDSADIATGAIPYAHTIAGKSAEDEAVSYYAFLELQEQNELMVQTIRSIQKNDPTQSIAILIRSRTQIYEILRHFNQADINYQAIDIQPLAQQPEVQDLISLTRALLHRDDKIAWLAILRAPWCGMTLSDLLIISEHAQQLTIWQALCSSACINTLSPEGQRRLSPLHDALTKTIKNQGRTTLTHSVISLWRAIQGPQCINNQQRLTNCYDYLDFLQALEGKNIILTTEQLLIHVDKLYAQPNPSSDQPVQILTIHKAKGLEFDHVILPNLNHRPQTNDSQLLLWQERPSLAGEEHLLLAPIKSQQEQTDEIYNYLNFLEKQKLEFESARLLYVAATRAKRQLHLFAQLAQDEKTGKIKAPIKMSFLDMLWPSSQAKFIDTLTTSPTPQEQKQEQAQINLAITRLTLKHFPSAATINCNEPQKTDHITHTPTTQSISQTQLIGTIIHQTLEKISQLGIEQWQLFGISKERLIWSRGLRPLNLDSNAQQTCLGHIEKAILNALNDSHGQWLLCNTHTFCASEYAITTIENNKPRQLIIDRFIIDDSKTAWIVDYKTSSPLPEQSIEDFIEQARVEHHEQLNTYRLAIEAIHTQPIYCALYFPMLPRFINLTSINADPLNTSSNLETIS